MIWLNGTLTEPAAARIDPADRGLLLGDGLFETVRVQARQPRHLHRHLARLQQGASVLQIAMPWSQDEIGVAVASVLQSCAAGDAALRITLTRGPAPRGLLPAADTRPTLLIAASPFTPPAPAAAIVATCTRRNEHSPLSRIKSLNYGDSLLARQEAHSRGADEAFLLNTQGFLAEACAGNVFLLLDGIWRTPPVSDGALPGIARARILNAGLAQERRLAMPDLHRCQSAIVTSSLAIRSVTRLDHRRLVTTGHDAFEETAASDG